MKTSRREALATIAAGAAAPAAVNAADAYQPKTLSSQTYQRLAILVDTIIPETETLGAHQAGVTKMVDEDAADRPALKAEIEKLVSRFAADNFFEMEEWKQTLLMTDYMTDAGERGELFSYLKNLVIDRYYSTEAGLVEELGYQGNTFLPSYPGCQHDHEIEEGL